MNMKLTNGLLGLGALLLASMANAATVSLTPSTRTVTTGDTFTLDIQGTQFENLMSAGSVNLTWDPTLLNLDTTLVELIASLPTGFGLLTSGDPIPDLNNVNQPGVLIFNPDGGVIDFTAFVGFDLFDVPIGPSFTFASLAFTALAVPGDVVSIVQGLGGEWQNGDLLATSYDGINNSAVTYGNADITVNAVPVPAAVWLFGSGLIGLVGIARRKSQLA